MIRVMLVDDHTMLREGLRLKLEDCSDIQIVGEAGTAAELMERLPQAKPQVVVLDMKLPDENGVTLIRRIKSALPACKVVVLTMYDHVRYVVHALESGAEAFVVKGSPVEELVRAVRAAAENKTYVSSSVAGKLAAHLKRGRRKGSLDGLSAREFEVLVLMGTGLGVKEISGRLGVSEKSVTTYRSRVMEKLQLSTKADLIRYAIEAGLIE